MPKRRFWPSVEAFLMPGYRAAACLPPACAEPVPNPGLFALLTLKTSSLNGKPRGIKPGCNECESDSTA